MEKWFMNKLKKVMEHNNYADDCLTVDKCDAIDSWTPCDLIAREYLNNGGGSAQGFLGITTDACMDCFYYMRKIKKELISLNYISETARNNFGITLWKNYNF